MRILASLPFPPTLQIHSIIGNRGKAGPLEHSSDGVVLYTSSHLPGLGSEKIVPASHSCVSHPDTMAEIRRILAREHLTAIPIPSDPGKAAAAKAVNDCMNHYIAALRTTWNHRPPQ